MAAYIDTFFNHLQHVPSIEALLLLLLGMLLESTAIPVPSEVVLPIAGLWVAQGKFAPGTGGILEAMVAVMAGSLIGSSISYGIGYYGGKPFLRRFGKYFRMTPNRIESSEAWLKQHGPWSIAVGRLLFGVRHFQSMAAGALRMSFRPFLLYTFLGCAIWNTLGVYLGFRFGDAIKNMLDRLSLGMLALVAVIMAGAYGFSRWRKRRNGGA